jgi:hypothetical protein
MESLISPAARLAAPSGGRVVRTRRRRGPDRRFATAAVLGASVLVIVVDSPILTAAVAVLGAVVLWRFLPARAAGSAGARSSPPRQPASARPVGQLRPVPPRPQ